jgi:16S rRNA G966 N2-methylase RsmD
MNANIIKQIFPNCDLNNELKYDIEGLWSITLPQEATIISKLIQSDIGYDSKIVDATAGIGGNTISFANYFKNVTAIEIQRSRFDILSNNINYYKINNIELINDSCLNHLNGNYDGIYFDPPWGGPNYKNTSKIKIKLGDLTLEEIINIIKENNNKFIFFKLPINYDLNEFNCFNYKIDKIKNYQMITIY